MKLKQIIDESFGDYKECAMLLIAPHCTFKCAGCQNHHLKLLETQNFPDEEIWDRFLFNPFSKAIVIGGLEPFENIIDICKFIVAGSKLDMPVPIVIYTGYEKDELEKPSFMYFNSFVKFKEVAKEYAGPVIVKFGRYIKDKPSKFEPLLGVELASDNQYALQY